MSMITTAVAPAAGARYRKQSTGRTWHVDRITEAGLISLTEEFYGSDCERRDYVTHAELGAEYAPLT
ncbi:hypothetical protein [Arthrobacter methylotrophus]|uniref:Uncharacterized protein n=1 Tax=Arthrobacter methylotrophus TaxID=121291 RepID=A0ABV5URF6_9MICC